jgi:hypothetical protein
MILFLFAGEDKEPGWRGESEVAGMM